MVISISCQAVQLKPRDRSWPVVSRRRIV